MKRALVLGAVIAVGGLSLRLTGAQNPPAGQGRGVQGPPVAQIEKVKDNLFMITGGGGNTAAFITANGVVLVDTKLANWGQAILDKVKTVTDKPVTTIVNTHTHGDHNGSNEFFPATVEFVAHENTKTNMEKAMPPKGFEKQAGPDVFKANNGKNMTERTFKDRLTLGSGNERVELYYFGRAHTSGDTFVLFPTLRVLHTGDAFPNKGMPIMDITNGGSGLSYAETIARAAKVPDIDTVITGHNATVVTPADVQMYSEFIRDFVESVRAAKKAGQSIDDVANTWKVPERFVKAGYLQPMPARVKPNVEVLWKELN